MKRVAIVLLALLIAPLVLAADQAAVVGLVWWPADPTDHRYELGRETEACLSSTILEKAPGIHIVSNLAIRNALYPRLEPATQPPSEEAFAALLVRPDVQQRLRGLGLTHLVVFSGGTNAPSFEGAILCGAGYGGGGCLGFAWQHKTTTLAAVLWDLEHRERIAQEQESAEGISMVPAFILPIPLIADTHGAACRELGSRISRDLLGMPRPTAPAAPSR